VSDAERFAVFMGAAFALFVAAVLFATRQRNNRPRLATLFATAVIVVVGEMFFARYCHINFEDTPWWIYYGLPALTTLLLPPFALRMSRIEIAQYLPIAVMMAPFIHVFFSLFAGWHDYCHSPFGFRHYWRSSRAFFERGE
jgi:hypothetical protein